MKRFPVILAVVSLAFGIAGWGSARWQVDRHLQQKAAIEEAERAARIKHFQLYFGSLVKDADEVVMKFDYGDEGEVRSSDPLVIARLATIMSTASYQPSSPALWMSLPI